MGTTMSRAGIESMSTANSLSFEEKLDRLAQVAVRVGLGLGAEGAPTQELVMSASIEASRVGQSPPGRSTRPTEP